MTADIGELEVVRHSTHSMGGVLEVAITAEPWRRVAAAQAAQRAAQRIEVWASRLTRFSTDSDLAALNSSRDAEVIVKPTLGAALSWARDAQRRSRGVVDATMLDQRLAAESGVDPDPVAGAKAWRIAPTGRSTVIRRNSEFKFDLDGVAKGWIADRAADLLLGWPGVAVNADGDVAFHADAGVEWLVEITDPRVGDEPPIGTFRLLGGDGWTRSFGVATSGTSVHRWQLTDGRTSHHLIDRRTGRPAQTDVIQATVVAPSAREAEMIAKSAVILGSEQAHSFLASSAAFAAVLLLENDDVLAMPGTEKWLA
jgi:thiamine biosynthesis lipoprotein